MKHFKLLLAICFLLSSVGLLNAQEAAPSPFDYGKMWTFENPPKDWFKKAYDFDAPNEWFDDVRKSSLRFASWCSASFVSPDGLIMTNHHCSRSVVGPLMKAGENFDEEGFYAATLADERRAEDLFVEQLIMVKDITDEVKSKIGVIENNADRNSKTQKALDEIVAQYENEQYWKGLRLQPVTYYSGGKFSLYGYKKYDDIRLVLLPEIQIGFYGGDPDNFTYPRYNLDMTFWRAYDENGNPVNTSDNYFKFNEAGAAEGEPVFVIGNPGSTERYRTVAQLEYDRDFRFPQRLKYLENRHALLMEEYEENPSDEMMNTIFSLSNSMKAIGGIVGGLNDGELFGRKVAMENHIIKQSGGDKALWSQLSTAYGEMEEHAAAVNFLGPGRFSGKALNLAHELVGYNAMAKSGSEEGMDEKKASILAMAKEVVSSPKEMKYFSTLLSELNQFSGPKMYFIKSLLGGGSTMDAAKKLLTNSILSDPKKLGKLLDKPKRFDKSTDPFIAFAKNAVPKFNDGLGVMRGSSASRRALEEQIANKAFGVYGTDLPPDATFTLRISDGVIKGYEYNGTQAPYKTTFFGMYDRYYSNNKTFPWSLPDAWANPPAEMLSAPVNTVSTNDIIGGNSGSPLINKNREVVGLIFDGNIESLPGNFIFDEEYNRTVSVHAGGIIASMRYIYKADRLLAELLK